VLSLRSSPRAAAADLVTMAGLIFGAGEWFLRWGTGGAARGERTPAGRPSSAHQA
jgi:hypothetical protein